MENFWKNVEGYPDPTVHDALVPMMPKEIDREEQRAMMLFKVLRYIIRNADFDLVERIHIRDRRTGREWK